MIVKTTSTASVYWEWCIEHDDRLLFRSFSTVGRRGTKQITSASIDVMNGGLQRLSEPASPDNAFLLKDALLDHIV